ncbi:MAG: cob(I)yrinic acid a,c-diamide adenosyltransferase [Rhodospirillales bacterium]|nr:cob(I)yrinic acid a,c-diamide adenosyltransferase [Rhodospirillales bacterium]
MSRAVLDAGLASLDAVYARLAAELHFPAHFRPNLDALWDVLTTDIPGPVEIVWRDSAAVQARLGADFARIGACVSPRKAWPLRWLSSISFSRGYRARSRMVKLTKIYTRGGDAGETSLGDGTRTPKHDLRVAAYGTVDEANAAIGLARLHTKGAADAMLARIQNDLFDLGADLCRPGAAKPGRTALRIAQAQIDRLEAEIDAMNAKLKPLDSFILPGGTPAAAYLHLARTVIRRAERAMTELAIAGPVNPLAIKYANRVSDHLFVLARFVNARGKKDVLWVPGQNR